MFRRMLVVMAVGAATLSAGAPSASAQTQSDAALSLTRGGRTTIVLQENPSTGYKWRLDRASSTNLAILRVSDLGFGAAGTGGRPRLGAPGHHRWALQAIGAGSAQVVFIYERPWEHAPVRRHVVTVEVR